VAPGQAEARRAQAALAGVIVGGATVQVTGLDALRAAAESGGEGTSASILVETLAAAAGALAILAFDFASFLAIVPLLMAFVAIPTTFLLVWPLASVTDVSVIVQFLVALIGLGIAVDYALLVVVRWREERRRESVTNEAAVLEAMQHAGSAVVFSGTTVAIGLLALVALPVPVLRSIGIAGMLIPLVSVALAITLLPVVLATIGPKLDWPRSCRGDRASRAWSVWARAVVRNRRVAALTSTAAIAALVVAASSIQLGNPCADSLAQSGAARVGLQQLEESGIGTGPLSPFDALVRSGDPDAIAKALTAVEGVRAAAAPADWRRDGTTLVTVIPTEDGNSPAGRATLDRIRAATRELRAKVTTGGEAAQSADFLDAVHGNFPLTVVLIAGIIISRMREAYERTRSTETAVVEGVGRTGRLVTSAALILGLAFVAFSASPGTEAKIFATALGGGILLDATIIRGVLAPAAVSILGRWNWWLPQGPARVLRVDPSPAAPEPARRGEPSCKVACRGA
jgi:RND superfamily putative drug exporter